MSRFLFALLILANNYVQAQTNDGLAMQTKEAQKPLQM
jgi:hypothetical protein